MASPDAPLSNRNAAGSAEWVVACLLCALAVLLSLFALRNNDIWWLMAVGRRMAETGAFIRTDPWSFPLAGSAWAPQAWASGLVFYAVYSLGGAAALVLARALLVLAVTGITLRTVRGLHFGVVAVSPLIVAFLLVAHTRFIVRAHLFEYVFVAALLGVLLSPRRRTGWRWLVPLFGMQLAWTNAHPSFLLGPALVVLFAAGEWLGGLIAPGERGSVRGLTLRQLGVLAAVLAVASVVNPDPVRFLSQPFVSGQRELLARFTLEWKSPFDAALSGASFHPWYEVLLGMSAAAMALAGRRLRPGPALLLLATALASFQSHRFRVEFALVAVPVIALLLSKSAAVASLVRTVGPTRARWGAVAVSVAMAGWGLRGGVEIAPRQLDRFPDAALDAAASAAVPLRAFHPLGVGSYMVWRFDGSIPTFIDGRNPSPDVYRDFLTAQTGTEGWRRTAERYRFNAAILPALSRADAGMTNVYAAISTDSLWALVHADGRASVYVRRDAVPGDWLEARAFRWYDPARFGRAAIPVDSIGALAREIRRVCDAAPAAATPWVQLATTEMARRRFDEAADAARRAAEIDPKLASAWDLLARSATEAGNSLDAVRAGEALVGLAPDNARAWLRLGNAYARAEQSAAARRALRRALELARGDESIRIAAFQTMIRSGAWDDALALANDLIEREPTGYLGHYFLAEVDMRRSKKGRALEAAERARSLQPRVPGVLMLLVRLYAEAGQYDMALSRVNEVLALDRTNERALQQKRWIESRIRGGESSDPSPEP